MIGENELAGLSILFQTRQVETTFCKLFHLDVLLITSAGEFKYFNDGYILHFACPGAFFFFFFKEMAFKKNENRIPVQSAFKLPGDTQALPPL